MRPHVRFGKTGEVFISEGELLDEAAAELELFRSLHEPKRAHFARAWQAINFLGHAGAAVAFRLAAARPLRCRFE